MALSLPWRRTPKPEADVEGVMTLAEHLRELRRRLLISAVAVVVGMVVAWFFYNWLFNVLAGPYTEAVRQLSPARQHETQLVFGDIPGPLMLKFKISLMAGLVAASPVWLYQIWSFITPGLHRNERKWTMTFVFTAVPLFLAGIMVGYYAMPKGLAVLINFTPADVSNLINLGHYLNFTIRLLLVFGLAFEIPVFVVLLNLVGVLSTKKIKKFRSPIIFGIFVFAAVATPSTDPITMLLLALPMTGLFIASEFIARAFEKRRRARLAAQGIDLSIDEIEDDSDEPK